MLPERIELVKYLILIVVNVYIEWYSGENLNQNQREGQQMAQANIATEHQPDTGNPEPKVVRIVPAAGQGSRLGELSWAVPKPFMPCGDKPLIGHQIRIANEAGADEVFVVTSPAGHQLMLSYKAQHEQTANGDAQPGLHIRISTENRGMPPALLAASSGLDQATKVLVLCCDNIFGAVPWRKFVAKHRSGLPLLTKVMPAEIAVQCGVILQCTETDQRVQALVEKPGAIQGNRALCLTGAMVMDGAVIDVIQRRVKQDKEGETQGARRAEIDICAIANECIEQGILVSYFKYSGPWFDTGTPERLHEAACFVMKQRR
jgi:NDP-sugar pyrophosphorylase family protein